MQAHSQSIPAARIPLPSLPAPQSATPPLQPTLVHRLSIHAPEPAEPPIRATGIADSSGLAHDAGNLLGALGLYCDLLRAPGVLRPEHRHYATELGLISSRSSELIKRLLELSPRRPSAPVPAAVPASSPAEALRHPSADSTHALSESNAHAFRFLPTDVRRGDLEMAENVRTGLTHASVLRKLAPVLERIAAGAASVSVVAPTTLPPLDLPMEALERIAVNLVRNAVEAIRKQHASRIAATPTTHGEIRVGLAIVAGRLHLSVEDHGPGIPPPIAAAFLRPAVALSNSGRGLGHRIVHELVASTGGQISIRSRPGQGTAFYLKWPLSNATVEDAANEPSSFAVAGPVTFPTNRAASDAAAQEGLRSC